MNIILIFDIDKIRNKEREESLLNITKDQELQYMEKKFKNMQNQFNKKITKLLYELNKIVLLNYL